MDTNNRIETEMKLITRRTKWLRFFKWYVIASVPFEFTGFLIFAARKDPASDAIAVGLAVETVVLIGGAIVLHFVHTLFRAVTVVLDELRTTV